MDCSWEPSSLDRHVQEPFLYQENQAIGLQSQISLPQNNDPLTEQLLFTNSETSQFLNAYSVAPQSNSNYSHSFSNVGQISVAPVAAPPPRRRKRKAPTLRSGDWEPVKSRIIELHITQNLPLPDVKNIIETEFETSGFSAT